MSQQEWGHWWGPVFEAERAMRARRWQGYALRAVFVGVLLLGLVLIWISRANAGEPPTLETLAGLGQSVYSILVVIELSAVLFLAPVATAGAICLDRSRGTLAHVFLTDLTDREIILGKLAARLLPVWALLACALPVLALATLFGGIDPVALLSLFVMAAGLAFLGCSLALTLSVWARRPHEVLAIVFGIWAAWLLYWPYREFVVRLGTPGPEWIEWTNPFYLALAPYRRPGETTLVAPLLFSLGCGLVGAGLLAVAIGKVRVVGCRSPRVRTRARRTGRAGGVGRLLGRGRHWITPQLDANPVLWREWHRNQPSGWLRLVWLGYAISVSGLCGSYLILKLTGPYNGFHTQMTGLVVGMLATVGLLLVSVTAAAVLAEERVQGSLDVLLVTPISTRSIVRAKWLGAFRRVPWVACWPAVLGITYPLVDDLGVVRTAVYLLVPVLIVAEGAFLVSLGLALATWIKRPGQATAGTITTLVLAVVGWLVLGLYLPLHEFLGIEPRGGIVHELLSMGAMMGSPFFNSFVPLVVVSKDFAGIGDDVRQLAALILLVCWTAIYAGLAWALFEATVRTFDRCLGRMADPWAMIRPAASDEDLPPAMSQADQGTRSTADHPTTLTTPG